MKKEYHYDPELDVDLAKKTAEFIKKAAEEYIFDPNTEVMPVPRHWGEFPGKTKVCFTKTLEPDGCLYYLLSVSAPYVRVSDMMATALLKLFDAPPTVMCPGNPASDRSRCAPFLLAGGQW
ncbi:hypothetical protein MGLY_35430 (plasmid) [Neomoorella glycerini]|uniref:Uncharacterized protein n=1 Tax=Neomoorella glycerini TaxID=55779 RepID=A0A6I5ZX00_9FIRM|nr:hypothetical protein [Moorella glycerini]QGP94118.1 hypothetical protein MGLY_35430 [Moorella glycerini]